MARPNDFVDIIWPVGWTFPSPVLDAKFETYNGMEKFNNWSIPNFLILDFNEKVPILSTMTFSPTKIFIGC